MGQSNSSINEKARIKFLHDHGFEELRRGEGHDTWVNQKLLDLVTKHGIDIDAPANFKSGNAHPLGKVTIASNPGKGTWDKTCKYVAWCHDTVAAIEKNPGAFPKKSNVASQFARAAARAPSNDGKRRKNKPRHDKSAIHRPSPV